MKKQTLAIVEPSELVAEGFQSMLYDAPDFKIVRVYHEGLFSSNIILSGVDMLIVDPRLSAEAHLSKFVKDCRSEHKDIVIVALQTSYIPSMMMSYFDSVIELDDDKTIILTKLRNANRRVSDGGGTESGELSLREKEVLVLVAKGKTNKEIADELCISIHTVIAHRKNISGKTNIKSISGLTLYALLNNLISQDEVK